MISKHRFLVIALVAVLLVSTACAAPTAPVPAAEAPLAANDTASTQASAVNADGTCAVVNEAPELAEEVAAGKLPPAKDRLPEHPLVVKP